MLYNDIAGMNYAVLIAKGRNAAEQKGVSVFSVYPTEASVPEKELRTYFTGIHPRRMRYFPSAWFFICEKTKGEALWTKE